MKEQHDAFWNAIVAAESPTAEEMAQAEAALRELETTEPVSETLPQARIDAMIAAAVAPVEVVGGPPPRRPGVRRLLAIAAVLFLSLSVAWVGYKLIWPEEKYAPDTLDYAEAVLVATDAHRQELVTLAALFIIERDCHYAFPEIRNLCAEEVPTLLRDQARLLRDELLSLLTRGIDRAPAAADLGLLAATHAARDASLPIEQRQQALAHLGHLCKQGMRAFMLADVRTPNGRATRDVYRQRLVRDLTQ